MSNKRSLAMAIVVTSAIPAYAVEVVDATVVKGSAEADKLVKDLRTLITVDDKKFQVKLEEGKIKDIEFNDKKEAIYGIVVTERDLTSDQIQSLYTLNETNGKHEFSSVTKDSEGKDEQVEITNLIELSLLIDKLDTDEIIKVYVVDKGHEVVNGKISPVLVDKEGNVSGDLEAQVVGKVTVEAEVSEKKVLNIEDIYDGEIFKSEGIDLLKIFNDIKYNKYGYQTKNYKITEIKSPKLGADNKIISMTVKVDYKDADKLNKNIKIIINSKDAGDSLELVNYLNNPQSYTKTTKLAGEDRYETAVEIAKASGLSEKSKNVVIVNSTSIVDGLTAAPYAHAIGADILLTTKDHVPQATLDFIKDNKIEKVTIIGGKSVVSDEVATKLASVVKVQVNRLGGIDREQTSVIVANRMKKYNYNTDGYAFVVGATGEADAMSIAPVAVSMNAPIIIEGFKELSVMAKETLRGLEIDAIGGKVTDKTIETLKILDKYNKVNVISGSDRFSTNAKIVKEYYVGKDVKNIYIAKDGYTEANNEALADALSVGVLAGTNGDTRGPVVLASTDLTIEQKEAIKLVQSKNYHPIGTATQVGNGIKHSVMSSINKLVELTY